MAIDAVVQDVKPVMIAHVEYLWSRLFLLDEAEAAFACMPGHITRASCA